MAYLKPADILASGNFTGYTFREVRAMLAHYGFEAYSRGAGTPHIGYAHREYSDIKPMSIPHHGGELKWAYTREACQKCMEVKQHNAARREKINLEPIPEWITSTLSKQATVQPEGNELFITCNGDDAPVRGYRLQYWSKRLTIQSLDFPDTVVHPLRFSIVDGASHREQSFAAAFTAFDRGVAAHMAARESEIEKTLGKLREEGGFEVIKDNKDAHQATLMHLRHPVYDLSQSIVLPEPNRCSTLGTLQALNALKAAHEERYFEQEEFKEEMKEQGWEFHEESPANGHAGSAAFVKGDERIPVTTHGVLGMFDVNAVRQMRDKPPGTIVQEIQTKKGITPEQRKLKKAVDNHQSFRTRDEFCAALKIAGADFTVEPEPTGKATGIKVNYSLAKTVLPTIFGTKSTEPVMFLSYENGTMPNGDQARMRTLLTMMLQEALHGTDAMVAKMTPPTGPSPVG